jgi:hypothetical protein
VAFWHYTICDKCTTKCVKEHMFFTLCSVNLCLPFRSKIKITTLLGIFGIYKKKKGRHLVFTDDEIILFKRDVLWVYGFSALKASYKATLHVVLWLTYILKYTSHNVAISVNTYRNKAPHNTTLHAVMCLTYMQKYTAHNAAIAMNTDYIKASYKTILHAGLLTDIYV